MLSCSSCEKIYDSRKRLHRHVKDIHLKSAKQRKIDSNARQFRCNLCDCFFFSARPLYDHRKEFHPTEFEEALEQVRLSCNHFNLIITVVYHSYLLITIFSGKIFNAAIASTSWFNHRFMIIPHSSNICALSMIWICLKRIVDSSQSKNTNFGENRCDRLTASRLSRAEANEFTMSTPLKRFTVRVAPRQNGFKKRRLINRVALLYAFH